MKNKKLTEVLFVYITKDNRDWLRKQEFEHDTFLSWYVNAMITDARKRGGFHFDHVEYEKLLKQ